VSRAGHDARSPPQAARNLTTRVWLPGLVGLLLAAAIVGGRLSASGGDPSTFIRAGGSLVDPARVPPSLRLVPEAGIYDGEFFYRLALDPLAVRDVGIQLDGPAYRHQRLLYPLIVWVLSLGQPVAAAWLLVLINALGLGVLGVLGGQLAREEKHPAWWGIGLPLYAGFTYSLARDLAEIVEACWLAGMLLAIQRRAWRWAALALALAVLSRESAFIFGVGLLIEWLLARVVLHRRPGAPLYVGLTGPLIYMALQLGLWLRWRVLPLVLGSGGEITAGPPLSAPLHYAMTVGRLGLVELAFFGGLVALALTARGVPLYLRVGLLLYLGLLAILSGRVWEGDVGWLRAATEASVLAWVALLHADARRTTAALLGGAVLWPAVARWAITT
jgi:hypothetical protein